MFKGIIEEIGIIDAIDQKRDGLAEICVRSRFGASLKSGDSIAVNGVCLTVTSSTKTAFHAETVPETMRCTNLGMIRAGASVNLEKSLKYGDSVDGHFVTGHVDAIVHVVSNALTRRGQELILENRKELAPRIVRKGSIALNGVSLTVARANKRHFSTVLIPYTATHANLGMLKKGDAINVEIDMLMRYARRSNYGTEQHLKRKKRRGDRILLVVSKWHREIAENLIHGAKKSLKKAGIAEQKIYTKWAPGCNEIPFIVQKFAQTGNYKGMVAIGVIIKGETDHDQFVREGLFTGLQQAALASDVPITNAIVSCNTKQEAQARAEHTLKNASKKKILGSKSGFSNKGFEAAEALVDLLKITRL